MLNSNLNYFSKYILGFFFLNKLNSLTQDKVLDWPKLKPLADYKSIAAKINEIRPCYSKGEKSLVPAFSAFHTIFFPWE